MWENPEIDSKIEKWKQHKPDALVDDVPLFQCRLSREEIGSPKRVQQRQQMVVVKAHPEDGLMHPVVGRRGEHEQNEYHQANALGALFERAQKGRSDVCVERFSIRSRPVRDWGQHADDPQKHGEDLAVSKPRGLAEKPHAGKDNQTVDDQYNAKHPWRRKGEELEPDQSDVENYGRPVAERTRIGEPRPRQSALRPLSPFHQRLPRVYELVYVADERCRVCQSEDEKLPEERQADVSVRIARGEEGPAHRQQEAAERHSA